MKKIIALVLIMMVMGTTTIGLAAKGEACDVSKVLKKNVAHPELCELQAKADALFKSNHIVDVKTIETKGISSGEAKFNMIAKEENNQSWFESAIDWITFWN